MKRSNEIEKILDDCLERIFAGETVEDCLRDYPSYSIELRTLLEMATGIADAVDITPRPEFREQAARDFQAALRDTKVSKGSFFSLHRWAVTALSAVVVVLMAGGGTVAAASNSLPDNPLYNVKLATESVRIAFAFSDESKVELYAEFANERVDEIVTMAEAGNVAALNRATDNLNGQLIAIADIYGADITWSMLTAVDATGPNGEEQQMLGAPFFGYADEESSGRDDPVITSTTPAPTAAITAPDGSFEVSGDQKALTAPDRVPVNESNESGESAYDLRGSVMADAISNSMKLEEAKEQAPENIREALERAIQIAMSGYNVAISNIE